MRRGPALNICPLPKCESSGGDLRSSTDNITMLGSRRHAFFTLSL